MRRMLDYECNNVHSCYTSYNAEAQPFLSVPRAHGSFVSCDNGSWNASAHVHRQPESASALAEHVSDRDWTGPERRRYRDRNPGKCAVADPGQVIK